MRRILPLHNEAAVVMAAVAGVSTVVEAAAGFTAVEAGDTVVVVAVAAATATIALPAAVAVTMAAAIGAVRLPGDPIMAVEAVIHTEAAGDTREIGAARDTADPLEQGQREQMANGIRLAGQIEAQVRQRDAVVWAIRSRVRVRSVMGGRMVAQPVAARAQAHIRLV